MAMFDSQMGGKKPDAAQPATDAQAGEPAANLVDTTIHAKVEPIVQQLRPYLQADGGDIELIRVEDRVVYVRLVGACVGCPGSTMTLKMGVQARIVEAVPEVRSVEMA